MKPNIEPKDLDPLERAGIDRVKIQLMSPPRENHITVDGVSVMRGVALQWLSWKVCQKEQEARQKAQLDRAINVIAMLAAIAAAIFSFLSWR
ncbi:MAG: hypothetical protein ACLQFI_14190 [Methylocella sp.]